MPPKNSKPKKVKPTPPAQRVIGMKCIKMFGRRPIDDWFPCRGGGIRELSPLESQRARQGVWRQNHTFQQGGDVMTENEAWKLGVDAWLAWLGGRESGRKWRYEDARQELRNFEARHGRTPQRGEKWHYAGRI